MQVVTMNPTKGQFSLHVSCQENLQYLRYNNLAYNSLRNGSWWMFTCTRNYQQCSWIRKWALTPEFATSQKVRFPNSIFLSPMYRLYISSNSIYQFSIFVTDLHTFLLFLWDLSVLSWATLIILSCPIVTTCHTKWANIIIYLNYAFWSEDRRPFQTNRNLNKSRTLKQNLLWSGGDIIRPVMNF